MNHTALVPIHHPVAKSWADLPLDARHEAELKTSCITPEVAAARGSRSVHDPAVLADLNFADYQQRLVPGLLLPMHGLDGEITNYQYKPSKPRTARKKPGKPRKYENVPNRPLTPDVPPSVLDKVLDRSIPLYLTEGLKKGDALASAGEAVIAYAGVTMWNTPAARTFHDRIAFKGREVRLLFDGDWTANPDVERQLRAFSADLHARGAIVSIVTLPAVPGLAKTGVDDWLANGGDAADIPSFATNFTGRPELGKLDQNASDLTALEQAIVGNQEAVEAWKRIAAWIAARDVETARLRTENERLRLFKQIAQSPELGAEGPTAASVVFDQAASKAVGEWGLMPDKRVADNARVSVKTARRHLDLMAPALKGIIETRKQFIPAYGHDTTLIRLLVSPEAALTAIRDHVPERPKNGHGGKRVTCPHCGAENPARRQTVLEHCTVCAGLISEQTRDLPPVPRLHGQDDQGSESVGDVTATRLPGQDDHPKYGGTAGEGKRGRAVRPDSLVKMPSLSWTPESGHLLPDERAAVGRADHVRRTFAATFMEPNTCHESVEAARVPGWDSAGRGEPGRDRWTQ